MKQFVSSLEVAFWSDPRMPYVEVRKACQSRISSDQSHFHRVFKSLTGVTLKQYQLGF